MFIQDIFLLLLQIRTNHLFSFKNPCSDFEQLNEPTLVFQRYSLLKKYIISPLTVLFGNISSANILL